MKMDAVAKKKLLVGIFGFLSVVSLLSAIAASTTLAYYHRILPNTRVAGVDISNGDPGQAIAALQAKASELQNQEVTITLNDKTATTTLSELGVELAPTQSPALATASQDLLLWLKPRYWQAFFIQKSYAFGYRINDEKLQAVIGTKLGVSNTAVNASLAIENNTLVVKNSTAGVSLDYGQIKQAIDQQLTSGATQPIAATFTETTPEISTEMATATKLAIESSLKPVTFQTDSQKYSLSVGDLLTTIDYKLENGTLNWAISKEKLVGLLSDKIVKKIALKMIRKAIMSDTGEVVTQGRDGKEVNTATLTDSTYRTITENSADPVTIPVKTIAFTEQIVHPDYVANLFPGLYVDISLKTQTMYIMNGGTKTQQFLISSGKRGLPTPKGLFYVKNKIEIARSRLYSNLWMRKWNALSRSPDGSGYEGYGIHDLPCFDKDCTQVEGAAHLGKPVSHGCVRLGPENAAWFYDTIPVGTPVNIH